MHRTRSLARRTPWAHAILERDLSEPIHAIRTVAHANDVEESDTDALIRRIVSSATDKTQAKRLENEVAPNVPTATAIKEEDDHDHEHNEVHKEPEKTKEDDQPKQDDHSKEKQEIHKHTHEHTVPTFEIGFSLILGFLLMFLVDRLPRHASESLQAPQMRHISLDNLNGDSASVDEEADGFLGSLTPTPRRARSLATTTGLVIHAAADGIAMGASSTTSDMKLGFIIFAAIMIHKAPAAFGLTSLLLKQGLSKRAARGHLIVFSLAAPVGAILTWAIITVLGGGKAEGEGDHWWTGMLLLFSGGTFL